jgi:hypothetical protein
MIEMAGFSVTVQSLISAGSALTGVFIGGWLSGRHQKQERKDTVIKEKLRDFYGPMLAIRNEIRVKTELRRKVDSAVHVAWGENLKGVDDPELLKKISTEQWPHFQKHIDYDNEQMMGVILPLYKQMLALFSTHLWLAESSTRKYYAELVEFVEVWNRIESLPRGVISQLNHTEYRLFPLYEDLEENFNRLSDRLVQ